MPPPGAGRSGGQKGGHSDSRCVFVGNIPYDATEHQLIEFFNRAGVVESFRMVFDRETRKPKGYGFCEFKNVQMALCAIRNLDGADFNGRVIRVDHADDDSVSKGRNAVRSSRKSGSLRTAKSTKKTSDEITRVVSTLSQPEKVEIMTQMKQLIEQDEKGAKDLLMDNPQLAQALLLIEFDFELVGPEDIKALAKLAQPDPRRPPGPQIKKGSNMMNAPPPPPPFTGHPPRQPPQQIGQPNPVPPQPAMKQEAPLLAPIKNPMDLAKQLPDQQKSILNEVLKLTPEQILKLPPEVQHQIRNLQAQMGDRPQGFNPYGGAPRGPGSFNQMPMGPGGGFAPQRGPM